MHEEFALQVQHCERLADQAGVQDTMFAKADRTAAKLRSMRDLYIGEWDNVTELCEWLGFFEGAALVHWALVEGVAEVTRNESLATFASESKEFHETLLQEVADALVEIGKDRAESS